MLSAQDKGLRVKQVYRELNRKFEEQETQKLIAQALSHLKSTKNSTPSETVTAPSQITTLTSQELIIDETEPMTAVQKSYYDELVSRLKLALKLPEYGDVKIKLTLSRQGKVTKVIITQAKSRKNREYIEKILVATSFPRFGDNFGS